MKWLRGEIILFAFDGLHMLLPLTSHWLESDCLETFSSEEAEKCSLLQGIQKLGSAFIVIEKGQNRY
jgi:hypothetical protein